MGVCRPKEMRGLKDIKAEVRKSFANPVGCEPLHELASSEDKVVIISDDHSRPTPAYLIIPPLLDELSALGVKNRNITILVAVGVGAHITTEEDLIHKFGPDLLKRVKVVLHEADKYEGLINLGISSRGTEVWVNKLVSEADITIGLGCIKPSFLTGYSGGPKILLPGVTGRKTSVTNHLLYEALGANYVGSTEGNRVCILDGNPVWEDMLEAARMAKLSMVLNVVLNTRKELVRMVAGEVERAQKEAIKTFDAIYKTELSRQVDVAIISGYPSEGILKGALLGAIHAEPVIRAGGTYILVSACYHGVNPGTYKTLSGKIGRQEYIAKVKSGEYPPYFSTNLIMDIMETHDFIVVTNRREKRVTSEMGMTYASSIEEAMRIASRKHEKPDTLIVPSLYCIPSLNRK